MSEQLQYEYGSKTVQDFIHLQENGCLNLEPGFQRKSVWNLGDRRKLIQSVLEGYPVPSVFLYRRDEDGTPVYDVIDGKQRLETIFRYSKTKGFRGEWFDLKFQFPGDDDWYHWSWHGLDRYGHKAGFLGYKIQTVEVRGDLSSIIDLFVRINSTGKSLTSSEKRHAKYYTKPFLRESDRLARRSRQFLLDQEIITDSHISRMRDVELVSELLASIQSGGPIHGKQAVDKAVGGESMNANTFRKNVNEFNATMKAIRRLFPELHATRFSNMAEFYTLFMVVWELLQQRAILSDRKRKKLAQTLLKRFSSGVDDVRERQKRVQGAAQGQELFSRYLQAVQHGTDHLGQRKQRAEMVRGLFAGLFERKDERRVFSPEQRRLLWNSEDKRKCRECGEPLGWINFQVDHIKPHSRGGKTDLGNAALICAPCNASKGARKRSKRKRSTAA